MWLLISLLALLCAVLAHAALTRAARMPGNMVVKFVVPAGAIGLALAATLVSQYGHNLPLLAGLLIYAFGCELYIFLFTLVSSSVTVSVLLRLGADRLTRSQIDALYDERQMVAGRITRLVRNGWLVETASGYVLTRRGLTVLHAFARLRRFFGHAAPGEDLSRAS
jgi:hypothetical protein